MIRYNHPSKNYVTGSSAFGHIAGTGRPSLDGGGADHVKGQVKAVMLLASSTASVAVKVESRSQLAKSSSIFAQVLSIVLMVRVDCVCCTLALRKSFTLPVNVVCKGI